MISARVHYASLAMVELAARRSDAAPVAAGEISSLHGIPGPFLVQIFRTLRSRGWVQSVRGSQGGYRLVIDPDKLTLWEIAEAVGCDESACQTESNGTTADALLHGAWEEAWAASRSVLTKTTLAEIAGKASRNDAAMFYI